MIICRLNFVLIMTDVIQVYSIMILFLIITDSFKGYSIHIATYTTDKIKHSTLLIKYTLSPTQNLIISCYISFLTNKSFQTIRGMYKFHWGNRIHWMFYKSIWQYLTKQIKAFGCGQTLKGKWGENCTLLATV